MNAYPASLFPNTVRQTFPQSFSFSPNLHHEMARDLLNLLGVFVADEDNNRIDVNTVEPFDGVRGDVKQTMTALEFKIKIKTVNKLELPAGICIQQYPRLISSNLDL